MASVTFAMSPGTTVEGWRFIPHFKICGRPVHEQDVQVATQNTQQDSELWRQLEKTPRQTSSDRPRAMVLTVSATSSVPTSRSMMGLAGMSGTAVLPIPAFAPVCTAS